MNILETAVDLMLGCEFDGIYRDDGILVFKEKKTVEECEAWLEQFQETVNRCTGSEQLQFTMDIWEPNADPSIEAISNKISINRKLEFPYLDMEMYWREEDETLQFKVHLKENQVLKYLNGGSAHTKHVFKSIPYGVVRRLTVLTSITPENENVPINELYPVHTAALENAGLVPPNHQYPTLRESNQAISETETTNNRSESEEAKAKAKRERDRKRSVFFCIGQSKIWGEPIHKRLKRLKAKHGLTWLRFSMSYHKFSNLGQKLNSDLTAKVMTGIYDTDLADKKCNCNAKSKTKDGRCYYDDECRKSMAVYNNECLICAEEYIGKTQDYLKNRTRAHFGDVWKVIETGRKKFGEAWYGTGGYLRADAFAKHFAEHCRDEPNSNAVRAKMKEICKTTILWQGDRIQCMKSSRTPQCTICMVERTEILSRMRTNRSKVINDNSDIYASCKCRSRLHKFNRMLEPTLRRRLTPKKVSSNRRSKQKRNRRKKSINISIDTSPVILCQPVTPTTPNTPITPEPETPPPTPPLFDPNIPGIIPYETPTHYPSRLQVRRIQEWNEIQSSRPIMEV
jgi:hypothetical protein